jgi:vancomycin resistance protein VanW
MSFAPVIRRFVPFSMRAAAHRLRRHLQDLRKPQAWASRKEEDAAYFPYLWVEKSSPLQRGGAGDAIAAHTAEKKTNLQLAGGILDGLVIQPGEVFSFCRLVGPTTVARGFLPALEMHDGVMSTHVGGGLCQMANLLFHLAVMSDGEILERHRHGFDLYPDNARSMPFGYGATVFYNYVDFRWRNPHAIALRLTVEVGETEVFARIYGASPRPYGVQVIETDHAFYRKNGVVWRRNKLWRERDLGEKKERELLFVNDSRVMYAADHLVEPS